MIKQRQAMPRPGRKETYCTTGQYSLYGLRTLTRKYEFIFKKVFPDLSAKIDKLTPRIASLMSYQLLEQYSKAKIPHVVVDKKTEHRYRIERYIGLHEPPVHAIDLHRSLGISDASFYTGMARIVNG